MLIRWDQLPDNMKTEAVKPYYDELSRHRVSMIIKRAFDIAVSFIMLLVLWPAMLIMAAAIKLDSPGPVFFSQERVTTYGKRFRILKFRTMVDKAEKMGSQVTVSNDKRITRVGGFLRKVRLDEFPQLINILKGDMSYVGTRPEVVKYVEKYTDEMMATLLLPAGVTSEASIRFKDEDQMLQAADDVDRVYVQDVLPRKMKYNLEALKKFNVFEELLTMIRTVLAVLGKDFPE